jgi:protein-S-isoprenylcysteine O-methyltransferase Ste14
MRKNRALAVKTMLRVVVFFGVFAVFIFVPAGTLNFWQGWVFFAVFCVSTLFITSYFLVKDPALIARRIKTGETRTKQIILQSIAGFTFFTGLLVIPGLDHRFSWSGVPVVVAVLSNVFVLLGFGIVFLVFKTNSYTSATIEVSKEQTVVSTGVYAIVRNPMYFGAVLTLVFMPLALDSLWAFLPSSLVCLLVVLRLLDEEKLLLKDLDGYKAYCEKTRYRLIPYIW